MVSLISDSGLIGLQSLNARSGIVGGNLLQTENSPRFANQQTSSGRSTLDPVESNLGNIAGIRAAKNGLTVTDTALASAVTAAEGIRETVLELGAIAVQAEADNIDEQTRNNLIERFETLRERLEGQVDQATVGDVNLIAEGAGNLTVTTSEGEEIKVEAQDLSAQGLGISQISVTLPTEAKATDTVLKKRSRHWTRASTNWKNPRRRSAARWTRPRPRRVTCPPAWPSSSIPTSRRRMPN